MNIKKLKQKEKERNQLLAREQTAHDQAEELNRFKDEFLATLSHELLSPLNAILGWLPVLRAGRLNAEESARALETIEKSARTQNQLINDLLDVAGIVTGKHRLEIHRVELGRIIKTAIESLSPAAKAKEIQIEKALDSAEVFVAGDANRLQQIAWNLLSNAIKFTPAGGHMRVQLECAQAQVELTVSDTGAGINPKFLPHLFERFRQSDSSTTRKYGGLGLGLSLVRHLVELHGGTVQAESAGEGRGATFVVRLPLMVAARSMVPVSEIDGPNLKGSPILCLNAL